MTPQVRDFSSPTDIAILGGGPAGLASGWALECLGNNFSILEKSSVHGGNARTVRRGEFLYDTGPHRFHARDPEANRRVAELLGDDLQEVDAPARIYWQGKFVDFPLRPVQILKNGGVTYAARAATDLLSARIKNRNGETRPDFASFANSWFGKTIASTFLIPFSEKLWGLPGNQLSPDIAGRRLPGFSLKAIIKELLPGDRKVEHLEGRFLYPRLGYGEIADRMAERLAPGRLRYRSRVVALEASDHRILSVGVQGKTGTERIAPEAVINTLPITSVVEMMTPTPPAEVMEAAAKLRFRDVVLVALFIDRESISDAAVTYFQDGSLDFTRAHEPRNRSRFMSPEGKTSLVVEYPCFMDDRIWNQDERTLTDGLVWHLDQMGLVPESRIIDTDVHRLPQAYPVYSNDYKETSEIVLNYLGKFKNLWSLGRGGSFFYGHVHDFITEGFNVAASANTYLGQGIRTGV